MRTTSAIASAATALATIALVSACGGGGGSGAAAGSAASQTPTVSPPPSATSTPTSPSPPLSRPPEPSSSAPASSAPVSTSPTSTTSTSTGTGGGTAHSYQDLTITLPVADNAIPDAPPGLTSYVRELLAKQWARYGHSGACKKAPQVQVMGTRSDGFAYVYRAADPTVSSCPDAMEDSGGYRAVLKDVGGAWRQVMAFQDVPACATFKKWRVPSAILVPDDKCAEGNAVVRYVHG